MILFKNMKPKSSLRLARRTCLLLTATLCLVACDREDLDPTAVPGEQVDNGDDPADNTGTPTLSCQVDPVASTLTTAGEIAWPDAEPTVEITRSKSEGCLQGMNIEIGGEDGCRLKLSIQVSEADLTIESGTLTIVDACASDLSIAEGIYVADSETSTAGVVQDITGAYSDDDGCVLLDTLSLIGRVSFRKAASQTEVLAVYLDTMPISGSVMDALTDGGSCADPAVSCAGMNCGEDAYGIACGECSDELVCKNNSCGEALCPPAGPYGTDPGTIAMDVTLSDCDGNTKSIHDMCGANAAHINLLAGW